jgi:hypothetical protein
MDFPIKGASRSTSSIPPELPFRAGDIPARIRSMVGLPGIGKASATGAVAMLQHKSENFWRFTAARPDGTISLAVVIIADNSACALPGLLESLQAGLNGVGPTSRTSDARRGQGPDPARAQHRTRFAERKIGSRIRSAKRCNDS